MELTCAAVDIYVQFITWVPKNFKNGQPSNQNSGRQTTAGRRLAHSRAQRIGFSLAILCFLQNPEVVDLWCARFRPWHGFRKQFPQRNLKPWKFKRSVLFTHFLRRHWSDMNKQDNAEQRWNKVGVENTANKTSGICKRNRVRLTFHSQNGETRQKWAKHIVCLTQTNSTQTKKHKRKLSKIRHKKKLDPNGENQRKRKFLKIWHKPHLWDVRESSWTSPGHLRDNSGTSPGQLWTICGISPQNDVLFGSSALIEVHNQKFWIFDIVLVFCLFLETFVEIHPKSELFDFLASTRVRSKIWIFHIILVFCPFLVGAFAKHKTLPNIRPIGHLFLSPQMC